MEIDGFDIDDLFDSKDLESIERKVEYERMLRQLSPRDRRIELLHAFGYTQEEIARMAGLTQRRIGQILQEISKRLE